MCSGQNYKKFLFQPKIFQEYYDCIIRYQTKSLMGYFHYISFEN